MTIEVVSLVFGLFVGILCFLLGLRVILREHRELLNQKEEK